MEDNKVILEATKLNQQFANENPADVIGIDKSLGFVVGNSILNSEDEGFIVIEEGKDKIFEIKADETDWRKFDKTLGWKRFIIARKLGRYVLKYKDEKSKGLYAYKDSNSRFDVCKKTKSIYCYKFTYTQWKFWRNI